MTPPDTPEAVDRLANELDDMNKDETWVRYPTTLGRRVPAALRAYAQLLRQAAWNKSLFEALHSSAGEKLIEDCERNAREMVERDMKAALNANEAGPKK